MQVTIEYMDNNGAPEPQRVYAVVISAHHSSEITAEELEGPKKDEIFKKVVKV